MVCLLQKHTSQDAQNLENTLLVISDALSPKEVQDTNVLSDTQNLEAASPTVTCIEG